MAVSDLALIIDMTGVASYRNICGLRLVARNFMEGFPRRMHTRQLTRCVVCSTNFQSSTDGNVRWVWKALERGALPHIGPYVVEGILQEG